MIKESGSGGIAQRSYNALIWNYIGSAVRMSSQFLIGIVLARLLGPEAFGTVAIGWLMVGIGNLVADFGLSAALIQCKTIAEKDIRFAFTTQVLLGALLTLIGFLSANTIAIFFHQADAGPVIQAMAFLFLLQSFGQTAGALLRRSLNFKVYQGTNIASYLIGYLLIGIPCAYYGLGAWSLVAAQLVQSLIFSLAAMWQTKLPMRPTLKPTSPGMLAFGGKVIGANLASWSISNLDSLVIGRMLGVVSLGIYNRTMVLVATPINTLTTSLQGVLFAASSRAQSDNVQLKKGYFAATAVIGLMCLPIAFTVASVPETIVIAIYGVKWVAVIPILPPLALAMALNALLAIIGPVLMAKNKVSLELRAQLITSLVMVPVLYFTAQQSLQAIAWSVMCIYFLRWTLLANAILGSLNTGWTDMLKILQWPFVCAVILALLTFSADRVLQDISPFPRLIADIATAAVTLFVLMGLFGKRILRGPHGDYLLASGRLPVMFHRLLGV
ncbi:MAG: lipopolysaccharide biosynthesis protein [Burkholderiaceae bacterium]